MRVIPIARPLPDTAGCHEDEGIVRPVVLPLARREFLKGSGLLMGTLASGSETQLEGQAWSHGKVAAQGRVEIGLHGGKAHVAVSRGIRFLSSAQEVTDSDNFELFEIDGKPALNHLLQRLDSAMVRLEPLPLKLTIS